MFVAAFQFNAQDLRSFAAALADRSRVCWLDGSAAHGDAGRFSFLGCDPVEIVTTFASEPEPLRAFDQMATPVQSPELLHDVLTTARVPRWVGYVAYDACWLRDDVAATRHVRPSEPLVWFARYDAWLALDHLTGTMHIVGDDATACSRLRDKLVVAPRSLAANAGRLIVGDEGSHASAVDHALEQIARGNLYQVNLARAFSADVRGDSLALYLAMRAHGDVPFGMYLDAGDHQVLSRTMESFLHWERAKRVLQTRPIKGTIARSGRADDDEAERLRNDGKERAEHAMIVDLMRNDLGRVAEVGSVRPLDVMYVEPYAGLSHLVSTVACRTRSDVTLADIFDATFPPGSVTGTPKLAAINLIEALEAGSRGIYTGAVGHIDHAGGCNFAVAIRTAVVRAGVARYFAGGGIVEASRTAAEVAETDLKARVFVQAIESLSLAATRANGCDNG